MGSTISQWLKVACRLGSAGRTWVTGVPIDLSDDFDIGVPTYQSKVPGDYPCNPFRTVGIDLDNEAYALLIAFIWDWTQSAQFT